MESAQSSQSDTKRLNWHDAKLPFDAAKHITFRIIKRKLPKLIVKNETMNVDLSVVNRRMGANLWPNDRRKENSINVQANWIIIEDVSAQPSKYHTHWRHSSCNSDPMLILTHNVSLVSTVQHNDKHFDDDFEFRTVNTVRLCTVHTIYKMKANRTESYQLKWSISSSCSFSFSVHVGKSVHMQRFTGQSAQQKNSDMGKWFGKKASNWISLKCQTYT